MTNDTLPDLSQSLQPCWDQAKANRRDYNEGPWMAFHTELVTFTCELERNRIELGRYRRITTLLQEAILEHREDVPAGIV